MPWVAPGQDNSAQPSSAKAEPVAQMLRAPVPFLNRRIMMTETKNRTKRLVLNGLRLQEGENNDWYEKDGMIVMEHRVKPGDKIIMEFPNFSEKEMP